MRNSVILCTLAIALGGCAMTQPISPADNAALRGKKVVLTTSKMEPFSTVTVANSMVGAHILAQGIGEIIAAREGTQIIVTNNVKDPAIQISEGLAKSMQAKYRTPITPQKYEVPSKENFALIRKIADYELFVRTREWGVRHYESVFYSAHALLTDTKTNAIVARSVCTISGRVPSSKPSYDELVANQAAILKNVLHQIGEECTKRLQKDMFEG